MKRPYTPHNTNSYLMSNFELQKNIDSIPSCYYELKKQDCKEDKGKELLIGSNPYHITDSQLSTSAGESSDEDIHQTRLSVIPGLTMQGMVDEDMFEISIEEEVSSSSQRSSSQSSEISDVRNSYLETANIVEL